MTGPQAAQQITGFKNVSAANKRAKSFKLWSTLYADPFSKQLLFKDQLSAAKAERSILGAVTDSGAKTVVEVGKIKDKLVETKQKQAEVKKELQKKVKAGDPVAASQLAKADIMLGRKSQKIEQQLTNRVQEGMELAKAKQLKEQRRAEVIQKRQAQAAAAPHLADVWAKHDAMYEQMRFKVIKNHAKQEVKADIAKSEIARLPQGEMKDAKMERLRQEEARRRIKQELEIAKLDDREAGRVDARAKAEGMKRII